MGTQGVQLVFGELGFGLRKSLLLLVVAGRFPKESRAADLQELFRGIY